MEIEARRATSEDEDQLYKNFGERDTSSPQDQHDQASLSDRAGAKFMHWLATTESLQISKDVWCVDRDLGSLIRKLVYPQHGRFRLVDLLGKAPYCEAPQINNPQSGVGAVAPHLGDVVKQPPQPQTREAGDHKCTVNGGTRGLQYLLACD